MSTVLVTVGSTLFDDLVHAFAPKGAVIKALKEAKFDKLLLQYGKGSSPVANISSGDLQVDAFRFSDDIDELIAKSDLVISHAGAGSILTALRAGRKLIVVPNTSLMDNHQAELALALEQENYLYVSTPETLATTIRDITGTSIQASESTVPHKPFPPCQPEKFRSIVDGHMGRSTVVPSSCLGRSRRISITTIFYRTSKFRITTSLSGVYEKPLYSMSNKVTAKRGTAPPQKVKLDIIPDGICPFCFFGIRNLNTYNGTVSSTHDYHRLLYAAYEKGGQDMQVPLAERLFSGYFENRKNPGSREYLASEAVTSGVFPTIEAANEFFESDKYLRKSSKAILKRE